MSSRLTDRATFLESIADERAYFLPCGFEDPLKSGAAILLEAYLKRLAGRQIDFTPISVFGNLFHNSLFTIHSLCPLYHNVMTQHDTTSNQSTGCDQMLIRFSQPTLPALARQRKEMTSVTNGDSAMNNVNDNAG